MHIGAVFRILLNHELSQLFQIAQVSSEWNCDEVHFVLQSELDNVVLVIFVDRWQGNWDPRQAHVLLLAQFTII